MPSDTVSDAAALANELHAFCAAAPHDYPGHNIELFERVESFLRTLIPVAVSRDELRQLFRDTAIQHSKLSGPHYIDPQDGTLRCYYAGYNISELFECLIDAIPPLPAVAVSREEVDAARLYHTLMGLTSLVLSRFPSAARLWKQGGVPVVQDAIDAIETFKRYDEDSALRTPVSREEVARPEGTTHVRRPEYITAWLYDPTSRWPTWLVEKYTNTESVPDHRIGQYATAVDGEFWRWFDPAKFEELFIPLQLHDRAAGDHLVTRPDRATS